MGMLDTINKKELRDLLGKGWLTHDGMWFMAVLREMGIEAASRLNRAAIEAMAPLEVRRYLKTFGMAKDRPADIGALKSFMTGALEVVLPASVSSNFVFEILGPDRVRWEWKGDSCFAYQGMKALGVETEYRCGVMYRIECWFRALGIDFDAVPSIDRCLIPLKGACTGEYTLRFT